jgi:hypothetical protein
VCVCVCVCVCVWMFLCGLAGACGRAVRLVLFLGDRYLCIDMGDGWRGVGMCAGLRLVANSNAEACLHMCPFEKLVWARVCWKGEGEGGEGATLFALFVVVVVVEWVSV